MFKLIGGVVEGFGKLVNAFVILCSAVEKSAETVEEGVTLVNQNIKDSLTEAALERAESRSKKTPEELKAEEEALALLSKSTEVKSKLKPAIGSNK